MNKDNIINQIFKITYYFTSGVGPGYPPADRVVPGRAHAQQHVLPQRGFSHGGHTARYRPQEHAVLVRG